MAWCLPCTSGLSRRVRNALTWTGTCLATGREDASASVPQVAHDVLQALLQELLGDKLVRRPLRSDVSAHRSAKRVQIILRRSTPHRCNRHACRTRTSFVFGNGHTHLSPAARRPTGGTLRPAAPTLKRE